MGSLQSDAVNITNIARSRLIVVAVLCALQPEATRHKRTAISLRYVLAKY